MVTPAEVMMFRAQKNAQYDPFAGLAAGISSLGKSIGEVIVRNREANDKEYDQKTITEFFDVLKTKPDLSFEQQSQLYAQMLSTLRTPEGKATAGAGYGSYVGARRDALLKKQADVAMTTAELEQEHLRNLNARAVLEKGMMATEAVEKTRNLQRSGTLFTEQMKQARAQTKLLLATAKEKEEGGEVPYAARTAQLAAPFIQEIRNSVPIERRMGGLTPELEAKYAQQFSDIWPRVRDYVADTIYEDAVRFNTETERKESGWDQTAEQILGFVTSGMLVSGGGSLPTEQEFGIGIETALIGQPPEVRLRVRAAQHVGYTALQRFYGTAAGLPGTEANALARMFDTRDRIEGAVGVAAATEAVSPEDKTDKHLSQMLQAMGLRYDDMKTWTTDDQKLLESIITSTRAAYESKNIGAIRRGVDTLLDLADKYESEEIRAAAWTLARNAGLLPREGGE